jgi:hypothetical protein
MLPGDGEHAAVAAAADPAKRNDRHVHIVDAGHSGCWAFDGTGVTYRPTDFHPPLTSPFESPR